MGKPAARLADMHVCPMLTPGLPPIPHVGGPILGPGCPTVLIGGMPAAVMGDMCVCVGPPDSIVLGSTGVMIGGKPAARMGDQCAHGGTIILGCPTVLIGEVSGTAAERPDAASGDSQTAATALSMFEAQERQWVDIPGIPDLPPHKKDPPSIIDHSSIAFRLIDQEGNPIEGERYEVTLPDGSTRKGKTDKNGEVSIHGFTPGMCQVSFPDVHSDEWG
ncbi:MAG TPA: PAAR domain-containing protein [Puia sp.]|nr:PAAR domain-containing protein [Puia sp.]